MPTLAELLALPAGRELDEQIARLCGEEYPTGYSSLGRVTWPRYYSVDIAAAWPLMAEMLADEEPVELYFLLVFDVRVGDIVASVPTIDDAPLAIVRAWLTWKLGGAA